MAVERWTNNDVQQFRQACEYIRAYYPDLPREAIERAARRMIEQTKQQIDI